MASLIIVGFAYWGCMIGGLTGVFIPPSWNLYMNVAKVGCLGLFFSTIMICVGDSRLLRQNGDLFDCGSCLMLMGGGLCLVAGIVSFVGGLAASHTARYGLTMLLL
jgi:hypothetical protein